MPQGPAPGMSANQLLASQLPPIQAQPNSQNNSFQHPSHSSHRPPAMATPQPTLGHASAAITSMQGGTFRQSDGVHYQPVHHQPSQQKPTGAPHGHEAQALRIAYQRNVATLQKLEQIKARLRASSHPRIDSPVAPNRPTQPSETSELKSSLKAISPGQGQATVARGTKRPRQDEEAGAIESPSVAAAGQGRPNKSRRSDHNDDQLLHALRSNDTQGITRQPLAAQEASAGYTTESDSAARGADSRASSTDPPELSTVEENVPEPELNDPRFEPLKERPFKRTDIHHASSFRPFAEHFLFQCSACGKFPVPNNLTFFEDRFQELAHAHEQKCQSGGLWWIRAKSQVAAKGKCREGSGEE